ECLSHFAPPAPLPRWSPQQRCAAPGHSIDMTYVGPNPAINGYVRSNGQALRIVAGATSGGAALVVRNDSGIQKAQDFHGKRIASPQMGNTQDVALRAWLK